MGVDLLLDKKIVENQDCAAGPQGRRPPGPTVAVITSNDELTLETSAS